MYKTYVVIGLSTFGQYMVRYLANKEIEVVAIDHDESRLEAVKPYLAKGVIGDAKDRDTLEKLGVKEADGVVVTLGEQINDSIIVLLYLKEFGVEEVYFKVINEDHAKVAGLIDNAEIIFPERDSAYSLAQKIDNPNVLDFVPLASDYSIIDWIPAESMVGRKLNETRLKSDFNVKVVSIEQTEPERVKMVPRGNYIIKKSDILVIIGSNDDLDRVKKLT